MSRKLPPPALAAAVTAHDGRPDRRAHLTRTRAAPADGARSCVQTDTIDRCPWPSPRRLTRRIHMKSKLVAALAVSLAASTVAVAAPSQAADSSPWPLGGHAYTYSPPSCDDEYDGYMGLVGDAVRSEAAGNTDRALNDIAQANGVLEDAQRDGCSWAATMRPPTLTSKPVASATTFNP
jgi:hypothetical protein